MSGLLVVNKHRVTVFVTGEKAAGGHLTGRGQLNQMRKFTTTKITLYILACIPPFGPRARKRGFDISPVWQGVLLKLAIP